MKFENDFKQVISELDSKEKDKLLFRLLKKDKILAQRLQFELLGYESREERRLAMEGQIRKHLIEQHKRFSVDGLTKELRVLTKSITEHVKITTDKIGDVQLNLLLMNEALRLNNDNLQRSWWNRTDKLYVYFVNKLLKTLVQLKALHEDYLSDFRSDIEELGRLLSENDSLLRKAKHMGLQLDWLTESAIPEDIKEIVDNLRKQGKLKG